MATKKTEAGKRRTVKLATNADCRRFMARLINATYQGRISSDEGRALSYMVGALVKINDADLEDRLTAMEAQLATITAGGDDHDRDEETD